MNWIVYALVSSVILATADFLVKMAAGKIPTSLGLIFQGIFALAIGLGWLLWQRSQGSSQAMPLSGLLAGVGVGLAFPLVTLGLYITFGSGAPVSVASPIIRLGGLVLVSLVGITLLQEPLTWRYAVGMLLACGGIYLIITR
jgi:transporter family protein